MSLSDIRQNKMKMVLNKRFQGTRHKVSGPLTRDVLLRNTMKNEWRYRDDNR